MWLAVRFEGSDWWDDERWALTGRPGPPRCSSPAAGALKVPVMKPSEIQIYDGSLVSTDRIYSAGQTLRSCKLI